MMKLLYPLPPSRENKLDADCRLQIADDQPKELPQSSFFTFGSHGYYHNLSLQIQLEDMASGRLRSKHFLKNTVNTSIGSFAFPYGACARDTVAKAKKSNYKQLLVMDFYFKEDHEDTAMRKRFTINPFIACKLIACYNNQEL